MEEEIHYKSFIIIPYKTKESSGLPLKSQKNFSVQKKDKVFYIVLEINYIEWAGDSRPKEEEKLFEKEVDKVIFEKDVKDFTDKDRQFVRDIKQKIDDKAKK